MPRRIIKTPGRVSPKAAVNHRQAHAALRALANPTKAAFLAGFFKTGKGQYAEGDRFLGIVVPAIRRLARQFRQLGLKDCERLLDSPYNDERLLSLLILVERYRTGDAGMKEKVYRLYLKKRCGVNNWNLVDTSFSSPHCRSSFAPTGSVCATDSFSVEQPCFPQGGAEEGGLVCLKRCRSKIGRASCRERV